MLTVALTGGIGSGKSAVTESFQRLSQNQGQKQELRIIDSDVIARDLLAGSLEQSSTGALQSVYDLFGPDVFSTDENSETYLNREKMRELVFSSETRKKQLEELLHPLVYQTIFSRISELEKQTPAIKIIIIAIPLLFETGYEQQFDRVLVVDLPEDLQIQRSRKRDQCSTELIEKIISSQVDRQTRLKNADDVIDNSGTLEQLDKQVKKLYQFYNSLT